MSSAVISFIVDPTARSWSALRSQTTIPVETSSTIALGAVTDFGQSRAAADAGAANRAMATAASAAESLRRLTRAA